MTSTEFKSQQLRPYGGVIVPTASWEISASLMNLESAAAHMTPSEQERMVLVGSAAVQTVSIVERIRFCVKTFKN